MCQHHDGYSPVSAQTWRSHRSQNNQHCCVMIVISSSFGHVSLRRLIEAPARQLCYDKGEGKQLVPVFDSRKSPRFVFKWSSEKHCMCVCAHIRIHTCMMGRSLCAWACRCARGLQGQGRYRGWAGRCVLPPLSALGCHSVVWCPLSVCSHAKHRTENTHTSSLLQPFSSVTHAQSQEKCVSAEKTSHLIKQLKNFYKSLIDHEISNFQPFTYENVLLFSGSHYYSFSLFEVWAGGWLSNLKMMP